MLMLCVLARVLDLLLCSYLVEVYSNFVVYIFVFLFFFFKQKTAYEMRISDWSSDVCSSDLWRITASSRFRVPSEFKDWNTRLDAKKRSQRTMAPFAMFGRMTCWICDRRAAFSSRSCVVVSMSLSALRIIALRFSARGVPPGSRVSITLWPSARRRTAALFNAQVFPVPFGPSMTMNAPVSMIGRPYAAMRCADGSVEFRIASIRAVMSSVMSNAFSSQSSYERIEIGRAHV